MILATALHYTLAIFYAVVAILLMIVILLQRGKGVGLAGAFGGSGGHTAFGAKTGDFLTWLTIIMAGILLLATVILNYVFVPSAPALPTTTPPANPPTGSWYLEDPAAMTKVASLAIFGETDA